MTTPDSERDKLIKELEELDICYHREDGNTFQKLLADEVDAIADFIIADRARIVDPLVEFKECFSNMKGEAEAAINESLRRSGRKE